VSHGAQGTHHSGLLTISLTLTQIEMTQSPDTQKTPTKNPRKHCDSHWVEQMKQLGRTDETYCHRGGDKSATGK